MAVVSATPARAADAPAKEQLLKAAFVYNFTKFVEWPEEKSMGQDRPFTIGVIGDRQFVKAFDPIKHKKVKNRKILITYIAGYDTFTISPEPESRQWQQSMEALKACQVVFLTNSDSVPNETLTHLIRALRDFPILTVGENTGFLDLGGMINFLVGGKKVHFEINDASAKQAKLRIRSQLLRLAQRVISEKSSDQRGK